MSEFDPDDLVRKDIVSVAKAYVSSLVDDLEGDNDFIPFLMIQPMGTDFDIGNWHMLAAVMPGEPEQKNRIADFFTAACAVYNAEEVVFCSAGWSVKNPCKEEMERAPSDSPLREEDVFIAHSTRFTGNSIGHHSSAIVRENGKVFLSKWEDMVGISAVGRFAEAITLGLKLAVEMPPDVREGVTEMVANGQEEKLISAMASMISSARATAHSMFESKSGKSKLGEQGDMLLGGDVDE